MGRSLANRRPRLVGAVCALMIALFQSGCAAAIPREDVPAGWSLDVHQEGAWWTEPLIPHAVVVQRCSPPSGWSSNPDLTQLTGLPPGSSVEFSFWIDDFHCPIGWSEPVSEVAFSPDELGSEADLRRICSSSGLSLDESWRFLGHKPTERVGDLPSAEDVGVDAWELTTAAFMDDFGTVVGCLVEYMGDGSGGAFVELSVGADTVSADGSVCPVIPRHMSRDDDGTLLDYQLRGAGAVRDEMGRILAGASSLEIGLAGDGVTTRHPVVDGVAIVDAWVVPAAAIDFDWDQPPPVEGRIYAPDGSLLATCRR
ncbi:MAG: hypothetical protein QM628_09030 [Propionicimonas sp.]